MITERELRRIAGRFSLGVGQAEHEYAMLCVLDALGQTPPLSDSFCLKGGTALRLIYFDDWRHSVDLDFSVLPTFTAGELHMLDVAVDFPTTPTDDAIVALYGTLDDSSEDWDDEPFMEFTIPNDGTTAEIKKSVEVSGKYKYRVGVRRSGTTDTLASADFQVREDGVSA